MSGSDTRGPVLPEIAPWLCLYCKYRPAAQQPKPAGGGGAVSLSSVFCDLTTTMRALTLSLILLSLVLSSLHAKRSPFGDKPFGEFPSIKRLTTGYLPSNQFLRYFYTMSN